MNTNASPKNEIEFYDWLVKARCQNQEALLNIYKLQKCNKCDEKTPDLEIGRLTGAAFSLWRAAPLMKHRNDRDEIDGRRKLLELLIKDNAINYTQ